MNKKIFGLILSVLMVVSLFGYSQNRNDVDRRYYTIQLSCSQVLTDDDFTFSIIALDVNFDPDTSKLRCIKGSLACAEMHPEKIKATPFVIFESLDFLLKNGMWSVVTIREIVNNRIRKLLIYERSPETGKFKITKEEIY